MMDGDVFGVRIVPPLIEYRDTEIGETHKINVTVKNVSKTSKEIRYYGPQTHFFNLKVKNPEERVAAGLEVTATVEYKVTDTDQHQDRLVVTVDGDVIEVPLKGYPCLPDLQLKGPVNFGNVVANSKVISTDIPLINHGSKEGEFKIKYTGNKPIAIIPSSGRVPPSSVQMIKVEYVTKQPGMFSETAKVKLEGHDTSLLQITGKVVDGTLELLSHSKEEAINCVEFGSTYYGTDQTECAMLYNNGPESLFFVAVLDEEASGQEVGVDLTKSTAATLASQKTDNSSKGQINELSSLVTAIPNQGMLAPYEKIPIFFRFSPRWSAGQQGFKCTQEAPPRQDFALFMHIKVVGASHGFQDDDQPQEKSNVEGSSLEVALVGTALPVLMKLTPQSRYDFGECPVGEHVDSLCTLSNTSTDIPINFNFRRVAHFTARPTSGKIKPGDSQDIIFSFTPNQVGTFKPTQYVDVIGMVADNRNPFLMCPETIHSLPLSFLGKSDPLSVKKQPVFNPGITPKIANEVGLYVDTTVATGDKNPRVAMHNAKGTKIHRHKTSKERRNMGDKALIAFPNDRAKSVRPSDRRENYTTIFTREERYTYVDPDYAYTDAEANLIQKHKEQYLNYIAELRENRINKDRRSEFEETNNSVDIAIKPAAGLRPKKLLLEEVGPDQRAPTPPNAAFKMLTAKELAKAETLASQNSKDGLNAVPTTNKEKTDCKKILSPQELHQVIIGPPTIDFGSVCLKSVSQKELNIVNNLNTHIHVVVHVDCRELRQTSPLSQVVPPNSKANLPLIFETNTRGRFQRSLDYTINGFYKSHITVFAEVVPVALHMSTYELTLEPQIGLPADAGVRGIITLSNKLNHPADFTWNPLLGERGTAFSIRPATGTVEAFQELDCEVVFHPSYMAPEDGEFALQVHGGNSMSLKCNAKLGQTNVSFVDRRVMFGQLPLHLTTTRTAMLKNNSLNHAYFQVMDPNPFPGLTVDPIFGVVPVGGTTELKIHLTPNAVIKFDTRVNVAIRGWKMLELRMGGTVEPPCVDIDLHSFNLGGVFCGSQKTIPFKLTNKAHTKAKMDFDLSRFSDFTLKFPHKANAEDQLLNPGVFMVTLESDETIDCELTFAPTEVASYDFVIPVTINQTGAPSPSLTPMPPTPVPSQKNSLQHIINPRPVHITIATPRRKIVATALRQPLEISHHKLEFDLSPSTYALTSTSGIGQKKGTILVNNSDNHLQWCIDLDKGNQVLEDGVFKFLHPSGMPFLTYGDQGVGGSLVPGQTHHLGVIFCPNKPGYYNVTLPIVLENNFEEPYQYITIAGELKAPRLWFDPLAVVLTAVPLDTDVTAEITILAENYSSTAKIIAEVPEMDADDGSKLSPLKVVFPAGQEIKPCAGDDGHNEPSLLPCRITFRSSRPVSFSLPIKFMDDQGHSFQLPVTGTADNCLLTCYPFLAQHRTDHQIVCEQGTTLKGRKTLSQESLHLGEAVLVPCDEPPRCGSRPSTTATSSNFEVSSSSYEDSSQSYTESTYPSTPRDGAVNKFTTDSEQQSRGRGDLQSRSLGSAVFPEEDTEEGIFHTEVLMAVQRWFSAQGWNGGPNPIKIPETLRSSISKKPTEEKTRNAKGIAFEANNLKKECRTVYDMVAHLCGKQVPGIPINNPLPSDHIERAKQVYWQHTTLLMFLRTQGACISSIKPEYLMEPRDYQCWVSLQQDLQAKRNTSGHQDVKPKTEEEQAIEEQLFEAVSKRAWTDILLQTLKVLVLARITPRQFRVMSWPYKHSSQPMVDPNPLGSNVYSLSERLVLLWLNHHYEQQRHIVWKNCKRGGVPPSRWVVNFDFDLLDGMVLAAALGAHAPFLIQNQLEDMYTQPATAEQCLHNALKVVNAIHSLGIDYDIQAIDITDPNPISLMLLSVHLYFNLPQYLPKSTVDFVGGLHSTVLRQVRLSNPSSKALTYHAMLCGHDARDFMLPKSETIVIPPRGNLNVAIEFRSRFLRPAEAVLVLVGRRHGANVGSTLVFNMRTQIDDITPKVTVKCEAPCYELTKVPIEVTNPFPESGAFRIILVEGRSKLPGQVQSIDLMKSKKSAKPKKVKSRIDHGQKKTETEDIEEISTKPISTEVSLDGEENLLDAFSCPETKVELTANGNSVVLIHFLPFQTGRRQCSLIFVSENIGEFLYSIEATATLPLPAQLPFRATANSVRISSAAAAGGGRGLFGGDEHVVYWKCECGRQLKECLNIPVTNKAKEHALVTAAQQQLSPLELDRRIVTGTLTSGTVMAKAVKMLSSSSDHPDTERGEDGLNFTVELENQHFSAPATVFVPHSQTQGSGDQTHVSLPVSFHAEDAGHYTCRVILKAKDDVRVYHIECTVTPEGSEAQIEFVSPVHQPVTQNIPIVNQTNHDWPMKATIEGTGFNGPSSLMAKAFQTTNYPLIFRPQHEGPIQGELLLTNTADKVDHSFHLFGRGDRPLPLENLSFSCGVKDKVRKLLQVPNATKKKMFYKAESDIGFLSGPDMITVLPGHTGEYELTVAPLKRGHSHGVLTFLAVPNPVREVDSDGEEIEEEEDRSLTGYRVWYSVDVNVEPAPPERTLDINCACQKRVVLEVGVNNPTEKEICLQAVVTGQGLTGPDSITLTPGSRGVYELVYFPAIVGKYEGSLVFYHEAVGELWYNLNLFAGHPAPTTLPHLECELGRWVRQDIILKNPTEETLELIPMVSNTNNFTLERDNDRPIELRPHSTITVPVIFMPSSLGRADHHAKVTFICEQLGEWVYVASGTGLLPQPQDPVSITSAAKANSTLIIPYRNPMDVPVTVDVELTDKKQQAAAAAAGTPPNTASPFCLLLKHSQGVRLGPKTTLDIPISFAPEDMCKFESLLTIHVRREDNASWSFEPISPNSSKRRSTSGGLREICWLYPIHGYPELSGKDVQTAEIECKARERAEERLEVTLSGVAPCSSGPKRSIKARALTPSGHKPQTPDGVVVGETLAKTEEFTYELVYPEQDTRESLEPAVALQLIRQHRDKNTGLVVLVFNVVYSPYKVMSHNVQLLVQSATGGIWRYPLHFKATEPEPDDTITIEAVGLDKQSSVGFRLSSHASHPIPYNAYFVAGSDTEFTVIPQNGELLPGGTLITITFNPTKYGKLYNAKLIIQSPDMQWNYNVKGVLPDYMPPRGYSCRPMAGPHPDPRRRLEKINHIKDNLKLTTTAVSSPIKGTPVVPKTQQRNEILSTS